MRRLTVMTLCILAVASPAMAASQQDIDRLTTYAVILGRATACGADTDDASRRVGRWIDGTFAGREKGTYMRIFIAGMQHHAQQQRDGKSPDTCAAVRRTLNGFPWP